MFVRHDDHKFDYVNRVTQRKHVIADRIRYIGKESNNLDETLILGIDEESYLEYENLESFKLWLLALKPKDVMDIGISKRTLNKIKHKTKLGKQLNPKVRIIKSLIELYKSDN